LRDPSATISLLRSSHSVRPERTFGILPPREHRYKKVDPQFSSRMYSCCMSRSVRERFPSVVPARYCNPNRSGEVVINDNVPSGLTRDATSLRTLPKSNTVLPCLRLTKTVPNAELE